VPGEVPTPLPAITGANAIEALADVFEEQFAKPRHLRDRKINLKQWTSDASSFCEKTAASLISRTAKFQNVTDSDC
jgi:hypothetical protein